MHYLFLLSCTSLSFIPNVRPDTAIFSISYISLSALLESNQSMHPNTVSTMSTSCSNEAPATCIKAHGQNTHTDRVSGSTHVIKLHKCNQAMIILTLHRHKLMSLKRLASLDLTKDFSWQPPEFVNGYALLWWYRWWGSVCIYRG